MKKALIVGINKYPRSPLRGCINDVLLMYRLLVNTLDYKQENIQILTDADATKVNIIKCLNNLVANTKAGDDLFFHFSGHGSQVQVKDWTNNDEPDGLDEILCDVNLNWNDPIRDHDIGNIFLKAHPKVNSLIVLDCCHSGTGMREFVPQVISDRHDEQNRFLIPPLSNLLNNPLISVTKNLGLEIKIKDSSALANKIESESNQIIQRGMFSKKLSSLLSIFFPKKKVKLKNYIESKFKHNIVLISGCQENQTSADAYISHEQRFNGALTYYLNETVLEGTLKFRDIITSLNEKMDRLNFTQNPQLECNQKLLTNTFK